MIVNYPTGFFIAALPKRPGDPGNVTFTCSSLNPPRSELSFLQTIPVTAPRRTARSATADRTVRQSSGEQLIYSTASSDQSVAGLGLKQYESGETLDFTSEVATRVIPQLIDRITEIRHDTNLLDLGAIGVAADEVDAIQNASNVVWAALVAQLNDVRILRANLEVQISNGQKSINETRKALDAMAVVLAATSDQTMAVAQARITIGLSALLQRQANLIDQANKAAMDCQSVSDELLTVAQLIR